MVGEEGNGRLDSRSMYRFKFPCALQPLHVPLINKAPKISGETSSTKALHWTQLMIRKCTSHHRECLDSPEGAPLPTRVLDLGVPGSPGSAAEQDIKLYRSQAESAPYACLSHCWGHSGWMKTTALNIRENLDKIGFDKLPRTFREAVIFTRGLQIRYLWIDSLCIIQDDLEDWRRESVKMGMIYKGSAITLAASMASNNDGGCFSNGASANERGHKLDVDLSEYTQSEIYIRECLDHDTVLKMAPLLGRAWAYQEHLLSTRYLHFGSTELIWECAEGISCECGFCNCEGGRATYAGTLHANQIRSGSVRPGRALTFGSDSSWWHGIVSSYSALGLTFPGDRLPGIAGLAKHLEHLYQTRYLTGLWMGTLLVDLLWYTDHPTYRPKDWRAPTWSWASIDSPVRFIHLPRNEISEHCSTIEANCMPIGQDQFGQVSSANIVVSGRLIQALVQFPGAKGKQTTAPESKIKRRLEIPRPGYSSPFHVFETEFDWLLPVEQTLASGHSAYYLGIASNSLIHYGLVLNCVDTRTNTFERIGIASCRKSEIAGQGRITAIRII
jgi:hypothetical protein